MTLRATPSNILTVILLGIIAIAPVRAVLWHAPTDSAVAMVGEDRRVEGDVVDVDPGSSRTTIVLNDVTVDDTKVAGRVHVRVPMFPAPNIGDRVSVTCDLETPEPFDGFPYDRYLAIRNVYAVCDTSDIPLRTAINSDTTLTTDLSRLRQTIMGRIGDVLPEPESTLLSGLLLGEANFSEQWQERFQQTGTTHIVAASGYNVSLVVFVVFALLTWCGVRRRSAVPILVIGIIAYAVLAGLEPAVVRAAVMGSLIVLANGIGRKTTMRNVFLLAIAAMVTIEPLLITSDVGFGLSVLSTGALLWFAPWLSKKMQWIPATLGIRESFVGSLAATIVTLPLVLFAFGRVAVIGPIVNLLVLPFVPYAMGLGVLGTALGNIAATPAWALLKVIMEIIRVIASVV